MFRACIKRALRYGGLRVVRVDPLAETMGARVRPVKAAKGGIIMFDDYDDRCWPGARRAIDEFFADKPEKLIADHGCSWRHYIERA